MSQTKKPVKYCVALAIGIIIGVAFVKLLDDSNTEESCGCNN